MPEKTANRFWSSAWTIGFATSIAGSLLVEVMFRFRQPIFHAVELVGGVMLVFGGIVLMLGLAGQSGLLGAAAARTLGAGYGFMVGTYIGGIIQASVLPPFAPHPSISLLSPPIGGGVILVRAMACEPGSIGGDREVSASGAARIWTTETAMQPDFERFSELT
jgi:hypothetical protein